MALFNDAFLGRKVLVTGHAGFKGSWLALWLAEMGAEVTGYSLMPDTDETMYRVLGLEDRLAASIIADIRDRDALNKVFSEHKPEMVFHLAAQPLVRLSYSKPVETFETNVMGTLNVLEAARNVGTVQAFVNVTTDKCYENREIEYGYKEADAMGGYDMYSSSKGCSELLTSSYRRSFLQDGKPYALASGRAGNVIGGGDWSTDRLIPDCIRSLVKGETIMIRNPDATRPWQHVLEPLAGYLRLGEMLLEHGPRHAQGYNFGPELNHDVRVCKVAARVAELWGGCEIEVGQSDGLHEATLLQLDISKAKSELGFQPVLTTDEAIAMTTEWYRQFYLEHADMPAFTLKQIEEFYRPGKSGRGQVEFVTWKKKKSEPKSLELSRQYYDCLAAETKEMKYIPPSGKKLDADELCNMVDASLDMWLTTGRFNDKFEEEFARKLGARFALTVNSGSSANLVAFAALTSYKLGEKALKKGDEVIAVAAGFPTTVNPIIQNGMIPVFIDCEPGTYNIKVDEIEKAITPRTRAIFLAHTLGNMYDMDRLMDICGRHGLWMIEDSCDALGAKYKGKYAGTIGHIGTYSFYPAHHITMGEGGAVVTNSATLNRIMMSIRDWGRDCWCKPGCDDTCHNRFNLKLGNLPPGYDHKYTYSHIGYNLKITDWQAAIALAQLEKLDGFIARRTANAKYLMNSLADLQDYLILPVIPDDTEPSWFGFLISVKPNSPFGKQELVEYLEANGIGTRQLFAGNILRQPMIVGK